MTIENEMRQLVEKLPECYQPIFGFPQLGENVSRQCGDRLEVIRDSLTLLMKHYGRPLRLLDLGCAQGFFTLSAADLCESVLGIDYLAANVDVCNAARDAANLQHVRFEVGEISEVIDGLEAGQFDVVLGLSVFHHLCHSRGWPEVGTLLKKLATVVDVLVLELAEAREPLYWAASLPADSYDLIRKIGFIYPRGSFATHLGDVERTLYFCSDRIWSLGQSVRTFNHWTEQSHEFAGQVHQRTRRYFFADDMVAKTYRFVGALADTNRKEFANEVRFFEDFAPRVAGVFDSPDLISVGSAQTFGHLVESRVEGHTLARIITSGVDYDAESIVRQVLVQLIQLESKSLYHRDVRVWNVLVDDEGNARLIDFGAIDERSEDNVWPFDIFASFLIFVGEVASKSVPRVHLFRRPMLSSVWLKEPFRSWFDAIWAQSYKEWSFADFLQLLSETQHGLTSVSGIQIHADNWTLWRGLSERLLSEASDMFHQQRDAIAARASHEELRRTAKQLQDTQKKLVEIEGQLVELENRLRETTKEHAQVQDKLWAISHSFSWRITRPLRALNSTVRRVVSGRLKQ